jgi:hypothetical protein
LLIAKALAPTNVRAVAQTIARTRCLAEPGVDAARRAPSTSGFAIPFFICTSIRVRRDFDVAQYTQQKRPQGMSHPDDVGVSRHIDGLLSGYILQPKLRGLRRDAQRNGCGQVLL